MVCAYACSNDRGGASAVFPAASMHGEVIELCPFFTVTHSQIGGLDSVIRHGYRFYWPVLTAVSCIAICPPQKLNRLVVEIGSERMGLNSETCRHRALGKVTVSSLNCGGTRNVSTILYFQKFCLINSMLVFLPNQCHFFFYNHGGQKTDVCAFKNRTISQLISDRLCPRSADPES